MKSKTALVTGGTGFIGSHLVEKLVRDGCKIKMLVRQTSNTSCAKNSGAKLFFGDLLDKKSVADACKDVDVIFHLGGLVHRPGATYEDYWNANVAGTKNLFDACLETDVEKIVFVSTVHVLGLKKDRDDSCDYPSGLKDPYEVTKIEAEKTALEFSDRLPITIVRPDFVYGPRDKNLLLLMRWINKGVFHIIGSGNNLVQPTYVTDIVQGLVLAAKSKKPGGIYNLSGPQAVTMNELAKTIADCLGVEIPKIKIPTGLVRFAISAAETLGKAAGKELMLGRKLNFLYLDHTTDISKTTRELGYEPKVGIAEGVQKTVRWYKENGYLK